AALTNALARYQDLLAVHIVAHAEAGALYLGESKIDREELAGSPSLFAAMNNAIRAGGDLLIYGCDLALGDEGAAIMQILQESTHADIAASIDATGNAAFGGNWELEITTGNIEALPLPGSIALSDFRGTLQFTGTID